MYFKRKIDKILDGWRESADHKPILLRGIRQCGKTSSVRHFGAKFDYLLEVNLERDRFLREILESDLPIREICTLLSAQTRIPVVPGQTLLFLDEIQASPQTVMKLRYFYEDYPQLHVVSSGSLLEFALAKLPFHGVGRIRSLFMFPFSFEEYLYAQGYDGLVELVAAAGFSKPLPESVHRQLVGLMKEFSIVGGMPNAIASFLKERDFSVIEAAHQDILTSIQDDFAKYETRVPSALLRATLASVTQQSGGKFIYSRVEPDVKSVQISAALEALTKAGLVYPVTHTSGNGIPLGAEVNLRKRKFNLADTGLMLSLQKLDVSATLLRDDVSFINKGALAEVMVGNELIKSQSCLAPAELFYWHRESASANAELDYLIQQGEHILPIEVKAGTTGSMQSLRVFLSEKHLPFGIRVSLENFIRYDDIAVCPLYAVGHVGDYAKTL